MYKEKFQEWEFFKYIPRAIVGKLLRIADERKPKSTEFEHCGRIWTCEEIKKKDDKRKGQPEAHVGAAGRCAKPERILRWFDAMFRVDDLQVPQSSHED
jgi:hypothetical protein